MKKKKIVMSLLFTSNSKRFGVRVLFWLETAPFFSDSADRILVVNRIDLSMAISRNLDMWTF